MARIEQQLQQRVARVFKSHGHCRTCGCVADLSNGLCTDTCFERRKKLGREEFKQIWDPHLDYIEDKVLCIWDAPKSKNGRRDRKNDEKRKR